jgi:hypothetical protein
MKKIIVGSVAALAVLGAAGASVAGTTDHHRSAQAGGSTDTAKSAGRVDVQRCDSGPAQRVYNRIVNQPSISVEGVDTPVPGANLLLRGKGTINVTFSAEDQLRGSTEGEDFDWAELEVQVNGTPLQPAGGPGDPMAITGAPTYAMNSAQFCGKLGRGPHKIQVVTRISDHQTDDNLSLWLDDYVLHVERS